MAQDDQQLDDAIDRAVRSLMSGQPRPGMRQRVLRRIAEGEPASLRLNRRWAAVAAAICLAVSLVLVPRLNRTELPAPVTTSVRRAADVSLPTLADRTAIASPAVAAPAPHERRVPVAATRQPPEAEGAPERLVSVTSIPDVDETVIVAPLAPIADIRIAPLPRERVEVTAISVAPLQMEPVRIDALPSTPR
jgi:hypothetical protein